MKRNSRQDAINHLRERQRAQGFGSDMFDERFNRHFDNFDKAFERPGRTLFKMGLLAIVLNLIFWGALIAGIFFGLNYFGVI